MLESGTSGSDGGPGWETTQVYPTVTPDAKAGERLPGVGSAAAARRGDGGDARLGIGTAAKRVPVRCARAGGRFRVAASWPTYVIRPHLRRTGRCRPSGCRWVPGTRRYQAPRST